MDDPISKPTIDGLSNDDALDLIARLVDQADDESNPDLVDDSLKLADELQARGLVPAEMALLDYFRANAWACRYAARRSDRAAVWDFEQPEVRQQVYLLRRAINSPGVDAMGVFRRCQIRTNLGNQLDTLGRFVEARAHWSAALKMDPKFWMARANRGRGLMHYAVALYDSGHAGVFALHAYRDLTEAVALIGKHPHLGDSTLIEYFARCAQQISDHYDVEAIGQAHKPDGWDMGGECNEREYRLWCLCNVLFLNPLNDVEATSIAAQDIMGVPDFVTPIGEPPIVTGMFNELKQGFVSARWLLWEGVESREPHFSDRGVLLYNTLDYPAYGLATEKVKMAFRMAYSTLDKIAYFLNHYLALGIPEKRVSFRTIWRERERDTDPVRQTFVKSENWPLRGLFWLSKDLFEEDMRDSTEPEARALAELRNHLEHKYVKVHEMLLPPGPSGGLFHDTMAHSITRSDLESRTLRLLQLVRSALIYLALGMHREEQRRGVGDEKLRGVMKLHQWRDDWNR
ncbi:MULTISPECIES: LA2681 family HEPN domain-containing protein [unclassified Variovorax]|uniref:LA2681 family HEPN domain-containing protein n=1 Tax=unclassified Variovorax TaxID=663243 RepID=UPI003F470CB7